MAAITSGIFAGAMLSSVITAGAAVAGAGAAIGLGIKSANDQKKAAARTARQQAEATKKLSQQTNVKTQVQATASNLKEDDRQKRTMSSLRIPLTKKGQQVGINTTDNSTGLNIPT